MTGVVARVFPEKGFGFIKEDGSNQEFFFHRSAVRGSIFENLTRGTKVEFDEEDSSKGPRAVDIRTRG